MGRHAMKQIDFSLYTTGGYIDLPAVLNLGYTYTIIISMRGGGKTYGALKYMMDYQERFIYFRRNDRSMKLATSPDFHIFRELNENEGRNVQPLRVPEIGIGKFVEDGKTLGYTANLSTFASIRSIGNVKALGVHWLIFDEFIPQADEVRRFDLFEAWSNAEETLVRNTELEGYQVRRLLMANADTIRGDIVSGYNIGDAYMYMQENGVEALEFSPDMVLIRPGCAELASKKSETALYKATAGSEFQQVALANKFTIEDREHITGRNLQEYKAVAAIAGICIYKHKSRSEWYVSEQIAGKPKQYRADQVDIKRYLRENTAVWLAHLKNKIYYASLHAQSIFFKLYDI